VFDSILTANFKLDGEPVNATCLSDWPVSVNTYRNCRAEAIRTGVDYTVAAFILAAGLRDCGSRHRFDP
jgi:hypothetical protein